MIPDIRNLPYTVRLQKLGLWSLEYRQIRADLIEVYKIIHGLSHVNFFTFFEYSEEHHTRGHSLKLQKHRSRLDLHQHFSGERIINVWNKLDGNTVTAPTLNCFKRHLETLHKDKSFTIDYVSLNRSFRVDDLRPRLRDTTEHPLRDMNLNHFRGNHTNHVTSHRITDL